MGESFVRDSEKYGADLGEMEEELIRLHRKAKRVGNRLTDSELAEKIQYLKNAIRIQKENMENVASTEKEIVHLSEVSVKTGEQIIQMEDERDGYNKEYTDLEKSIPAEQLPDIRQERILIRERVEKEFLSAEYLDHINNEKIRFDKKHSCYVAGFKDIGEKEEKVTIRSLSLGSN